MYVNKESQKLEMGAGKKKKDRIRVVGEVYFSFNCNALVFF